MARTRQELEEFIKKKTEENQQLVAELEASTVDSLNQMEKEEVTTGNLEAAVRGAARGFTAGFDDDIASGIQALHDTIGEMDTAFDEGLVKGLDKSLSTYKEKFRQNKQDYDEAMRKLEANHPMSFNTGDIVGSALSFTLAPGPNTLKGAAGLSKLATHSWMHGFGRSDEETLGGRIEAGTEAMQSGTVFGAAGEVLGPVAVKKVASMAEGLQADKFLTFLRGHTNKEQLSPFAITQRLKDRKVTEFAENAVKMKRKDGKYVLSPLQNVAEAIDSTGQAMKEVGEDMGTILNSTQEKMGNVDAPLLISKLKRKLVEPDLGPIQSLPGQREAAKKLSKYIDDMFYIEDFTQAPTVTKAGKEIYPKRLAITDVMSLHSSKANLFDEIGQEVKRNNNLFGKKLQDLAHELHGEVRDTIKKEMPESFPAYDKLSKKYTDLVNVKSALELRAKSDNAVNYARNIFWKAMSAKTVIGAAGAAAFGVESSTALAVATGISTLAAHPQTNLMVAKGLGPLIRALKAKPDLYRNLAARIAHAATMSSDIWQDEVMSAAAYVDLSEEPLARTMDELLIRKDSVLTTLNSSSPKLAEDLDNAIRDKNEKKIGEIIGGTIGITSQMQPGIGFNGKVYTANDKQTIMTWIKSSIPNARQRMQVEKKFKSDFAIPEGYGDDKKTTELYGQAFQPEESPAMKAAREKIFKQPY
jgi:hypothetical protein